MDRNTDPRLAVQSYIGKPDVRFFNIDDAPFKLHGVFREGDMYKRVPKTVADTLNPRAKKFSTAAAGGRVRFKTNSSYVAIKAHLGDIYRISMLTLTASAGFDMYEGGEFLGSFNPPYEIESGGVYEAVINLGERRQRELVINMPPYSQVHSLYVGIDGEATLAESSGYKNKAPIIFYGSSITHGACASRPGLHYTAMLSRALDRDNINLGFGAGCRGEVQIAEYIASLGACALVCAYDHNAPNKEKLLLTHAPFVEKIREISEKLPIILVSRPDVERNAEGDERYEIIKDTFDKRRMLGDENVYLIDGRRILLSSDLTHDGIHPNDLGEKVIAEKLLPYLKLAIKE